MSKKNNKLSIPILIILPLIFLYFFHLDDSILLGGEGNYFLNFSNYNDNFFSMWSHWGLGHNQFFLNGINILTILFGKINNPKIISFFIFLLLYVFPFILFYTFTTFISESIYTRIIASIFYSFNPFTISFLSQMNIWNNSIILLIPLYLIIIFRFYSNLFILLPLLSIFFFFFNFIGNPPLFVILIMIINIFIFYNSLTHNTSLKKTLTVLVLINSFYAFTNLHILFPFIFADSSFGSLYEYDNAKGWLLSSSMNLNNLLDILIGIHHYGDKDFDSFSRYYNLPYINFFIILFSAYIFYCAYQLRDRVTVKFLVIIYFFFFFLSKGTLIPGGFIFSLIFEYVPYFSIFKTPTEKFSIIIFTILPVLILNVFSSNYFKNNIYIKSSIPILFLLPLYLGYIFANHNSVGNEVSRIYPDYRNDIEVIDFIDDNFKDSRVLHLPGHYNYQSWTKNINNNITYSGMDPILHNLKNNNFIDLTLNKDLYLSLSRNDFKTFFYLCSLYNVELIYINNRQFFPFDTILTPNNVKDIIIHKNIDKVYDKHDIQIYQIKNINNDFLIRSIQKYSKVYVEIF